MATEDIKIPTRITPCPIKEAFFELRFTSDLGSDIPGLLFSEFRTKYRAGQELPVAQIPTEIREKDPNLKYQPTKVYHSDDYMLRIGPRVVSLSTKPFEYPGWSNYAPEIDTLIAAMQNLEIVDEVERLGLRYINFFSEDIFPKLKLNVHLDDAPLPSDELLVQTRFRDKMFGCLVQFVSPVFAKTPDGAAKGSAVDLDVSRDASLESFFADSKAIIEGAHNFEKLCFFRLLKPEYLDTLNPVY